MTIEISVVTPTRNRALILAQCLAALARQSLEPARYEILVVDDGSTDGTPEVVDAAKRAAPCEIRAFRLAQRAGIPAARNLAIREARGALIAFVDSDEFAPPRFLASHLECHRRHGPNVICRGPVTVTPSLHRPFDTRGGIFDLSTSYFDTDNASVRREHLLLAGLFDESLYPYGWEGLDLGFRLRALGLRRIYRRDAAIYHYRPEISADALPELLAKEEERAVTALSFMAKNPAPEARLATCLTPIHRGLNAVQRGFGAIHAGNVMTWVDRARRWGFPGLARVLLGGVLRGHYFDHCRAWGAAAGSNGSHRRHPDL